MSFLRATGFLIALQLLAAAGWAGTVTDSTEYHIKAAYLYKFASYVEWPATTFAQANTPFTIGILGAGTMAQALNGLKADHVINDRVINVKILRPNDALTGIHMLFVGAQESAHLKSLLPPVQGQPILIVTESAQALSHGSIINFIVVDERVRFEVSVPHAERNGLKISARLLGVAQHIETGAQPTGTGDTP